MSVVDARRLLIERRVESRRPIAIRSNAPGRPRADTYDASGTAPRDHEEAER